VQEGWYAFPDNVGFIVNVPHRESFSPAAAWDTGQLQAGDFLDSAPLFAVEVRSKNDYGPAAEEALKEKCADYFTCGTLVVWDVDVLREHVIRVYRASDPENPAIYRRGDMAEAGPAVPGWRMAVDELLA
jgi:Uma2 family endonuclease